MQRPPDLIDRTAVLRHRHRARRAVRSAMFLQEDTALEMKDRLSLVNRTFTAPAVVTGFPEVWRQILPGARIVDDSETLDLEPQAHDLVIHALCLHWANDPVGQLIQCKRALRPDGLFLASMFGGQTLHELRAALAEAEIATTGGLSPRVAPMTEIRDIGGLLQRAGFALPVTDSLDQPVTYQDALALMRDLRAMGETNALAARLRQTTPRVLFDTAATIYAASFPAPDNRITATFEILYLAGWAPSADQPKPLRPGSATTRLADALGVVPPASNDPPNPD